MTIRNLDIGSPKLTFGPNWPYATFIRMRPTTLQLSYHKHEHLCPEKNQVQHVWGLMMKQQNQSQDWAQSHLQYSLNNGIVTRSLYAIHNLDCCFHLYSIKDCIWLFEEHSLYGGWMGMDGIGNKKNQIFGCSKKIELNGRKEYEQRLWTPHSSDSMSENCYEQLKGVKEASSSLI